MDKIIIGQEINCETGEVTPIYETPETIAQRKEAEAEAQAMREQEENRIAKRKELLAKLGLTEEEAALLLN